MTDDGEFRARTEAQVADAGSHAVGRALRWLFAKAPEPETGTAVEPAEPRPSDRPRPSPRPSPRSSPPPSSTAATRRPSPRRSPQPAPRSTRPSPRPSVDPSSGRGQMWRTVRHVGIVSVIAALAAVLLRIYVVAPYFIPSPSMEPTLHGCTGCNDDHVLVDKLSYRTHDPRQRDIVVFTRPPGAHAVEDVLIKRVIGLPGDRLQLQGGRVYINGVVLAEPYIRKQCGSRASVPLPGRPSRWTIPDDEVFVMGDNRCDSTDSRDFGPIRKSSIVGRAFAIIWPLRRITLL